ncbi:MAG: hypothetical protein V1720_14975 [bacterium]
MKKNNIAIENAWICTVVEKDILPFFGDIIISDRKITKIRPKNFQIFQKDPHKIGKNAINAFGRVITIPLVNFSRSYIFAFGKRTSAYRRIQQLSKYPAQSLVEN